MAAENGEKTMQILFITDYVCPYCLVAKEALDQALEYLGLEADITYQPYELTPEPRERVDTWHDQRRRAGYRVLEEPCRKLGLPMKLPPKVIPRPYTRLAFEGWYYACGQGKGSEYADAIYRAYFIDEQDIGQIQVLAQIAERLGLDPLGFTEALENGTYTAREKEAVEYSRNVLKPTGVPTIYIDGQKIMLSEYTKEEMVRILLGASAEGGMACGEDGCG